MAFSVFKTTPGKQFKRPLVFTHMWVRKSVHVSCLFQIIDGIFSPESPELPDIEFKSHGLKDLIKTGFR